MKHKEKICVTQKGQMLVRPSGCGERVGVGGRVGSQPHVTGVMLVALSCRRGLSFLSRLSVCGPHEDKYVS